MRTEARTDVSLTVPSGGLHRQGLLFGLLVILATGFDLGTKEVVFRSVGFPGRTDWEWQFGSLVWCTLQTNFNYGALWGFGQGHAAVFAGLSVLAVLGILIYLFWFGAARSWWMTVALAFITSGALGNLYDRLGWHGWKNGAGEAVCAVRDFLYFRFLETFDWPIFNFADSFLVTGAIMLVVQSLWLDSPQPVSEKTITNGVPAGPASATAGVADATRS
jgi:signal peptidase II